MFGPNAPDTPNSSVCVDVRSNEVATRGTIAEGAELQIKQVPTACFCAACALEFAPADALHECPICHRPGADVRRGREFELASLDIVG